MRKIRIDWGAILIVTVAAITLLPNLGHPQIEKWDESFHMQVASSAMRNPAALRLYPDHLYALPGADWTHAGIWLHKPPFSAWLGGLFMAILGRQPLSLRLVSWLSVVATALFLRAISRQMNGHRGSVANLAAPLLFLVLPFQYTLVQGHQFGDITDTLLTVLVTFAHWSMLRALRTRSFAYYLLLGILVGLGVLTKSALALTPFAALGIVFLVLPKHRKAHTVVGGLLAVVVTLLLVVPWDRYTASHWPDIYQAERQHLRDHLTGTMLFARPWTGVFTWVHVEQFAPIPSFVILVCGLLFFVRAWRSRELALVSSAAHIGIAWLVLSWANVKVPASTWSVAPLVLQALVTALWVPKRQQSFSLGQVVLPIAVAIFFFQDLDWSTARRLVFDGWLADNPNNIQQGVLLFTGLFALGSLCFSLLPQRYVRCSGGLTLIALMTLCVVRAHAIASDYRLTQQFEFSQRAATFAHARLPQNAMFFFPHDNELFHSFEDRSFMFWSSRLCLDQQPDVAIARAHGYRPYLVSHRAEPFVPVYRPSDAAVWIYDLSRPASPPSLPTDLRFSCRNPMNAIVGATPVRNRSGSTIPWIVYARATVFDGAAMTFVDRQHRTVSFHSQIRDLPLGTRSFTTPWFSYVVVGPDLEHATPTDIWLGDAHCALMRR